MTKLQKAEHFANLWRRGQREGIYPRASWGRTDEWTADQAVVLLAEIERLRSQLEEAESEVLVRSELEHA